MELDREILDRLNRADVKLGLDTVLCLRAYRPLEQAIGGRQALHPVRTLGILREGMVFNDGRVVIKIDDPVAEGLNRWQRESRNDFKKILNKLIIAAKRPSSEAAALMKPLRHKDAQGLFEVVGNRDHARVFIFYDGDAHQIIVGAGTYWKLGRARQKERETQNTAIVQAAQRRNLWLAADTISELTDWRYLRRRSR